MRLSALTTTPGFPSLSLKVVAHNVVPIETLKFGCQRQLQQKREEKTQALTFSLLQRGPVYSVHLGVLVRC